MGVQSPASYPLLKVFNVVSSPEAGETAAECGEGQPARRVALLVCHGMGQQVPFENIDLVASALKDDPSRAGGAAAAKPASRVRLVRLGDQWLPRAEVELGTGTEKVEAHVYEAYWAPLTEGRVKAFHVTRFLLEAGMRGLRYGLRGEFSRWVDGEERKYAITRKSVLYLIAVFVTVIGMLVLHAALGFVAVMQVLALVVAPGFLDPVATGLATLLQGRLLQSPLVLSLALVPWLAVRAIARTAAVGRKGVEYDAAMRRWTALIGIGALASAAAPVVLANPTFWDRPGQQLAAMAAGAIALLYAAYRAFLPRCRAYVDPPRRAKEGAAEAPDAARAARASATLGAVCATAALAAAVWVCFVGGAILWDAVGWLADPRGTPGRPAIFESRGFVFLFLASAWYASYQLRALYIQYMGDVAVYLSSHTLNVFADLRTQIRKTGYEAACAIYGAQRAGPQGEPLVREGKPVFEYDEVLVVGHSLGSVVAYDTLNAVLNEDVALGRRMKAEERTRLLITFGSPLDKSAFIFRTQKEKADFREQLAAAVQPLIEPRNDEGERKPREIPWINLFSPFDPVSGPVNYYDAPEGAPAGGDATPVTLVAGRVVNLPDRDAVNFGQAHVTYWKNPLLGRLLHEAITTSRAVRA